jgi:hypothetical protein
MQLTGGNISRAQLPDYRAASAKCSKIWPAPQPKAKAEADLEEMEEQGDLTAEH